MPAPKDPVFQCPKCQHEAALIDRDTIYRLKDDPSSGSARQVPLVTTYTCRCTNEKCKAVFTRPVKH